MIKIKFPAYRTCIHRQTGFMLSGRDLRAAALRDSERLPRNRSRCRANPDRCTRREQSYERRISASLGKPAAAGCRSTRAARAESPGARPRSHRRKQTAAQTGDVPRAEVRGNGHQWGRNLPLPSLDCRAQLPVRFRSRLAYVNCFARVSSNPKSRRAPSCRWRREDERWSRTRP